MTDLEATGGPLDRRELLLGAGIGLAAGGLASRPASAPAAPLAKGTSGDVKLLSRLLSVEQALSATYRQALAGGLPSVVMAAELSGFWEQEREHAAALERELSRRGARVPRAAASPRIAPPATPGQALSRLAVAEMKAEAAYLNAIAKLQAPALVELAAQIMASEAQHLALLRVLQNPAQPAAAVPVAFVHGSG